jgi:hypothetical protein
MSNIKVTIRRKKWLRGTNSGLMRNEAGAQCCLGYVARACGIQAPDLSGLGTPSEVIIQLLAEGKSVPDAFMKLVTVSDREIEENEACNNLISLNDSGGSSIKDREDSIKKGLYELGFSVTFTD